MTRGVVHSNELLFRMLGIIPNEDRITELCSAGSRSVPGGLITENDKESL